MLLLGCAVALVLVPLLFVAVVIGARCWPSFIVVALVALGLTLHHRSRRHRP